MMRKQVPADNTPDETLDFHSLNGSDNGISVIPLEATEQKQAKVDLEGQVALIVGGATENGRSLAVAFADRGVDIALVYFNSAHELAVTIKEQVEARSQRCLLIAGEAVADGDDKRFAGDVLTQLIDTFGRLDILINYSAHSFPLGQLVKTEKDRDGMRSQIFPHFNIMKAALDELIS